MVARVRRCGWWVRVVAETGPLACCGEHSEVRGGALALTSLSLPLPSALPCVRHGLSPNPPKPVVTCPPRLSISPARVLISIIIPVIVETSLRVRPCHLFRRHLPLAGRSPPALSQATTVLNLVTRGITTPRRHNTATRGLEIPNIHARTLRNFVLVAKSVWKYLWKLCDRLNAPRLDARCARPNHTSPPT
jgi:hypothetical protein